MTQPDPTPWFDSAKPLRVGLSIGDATTNPGHFVADLWRHPPVKRGPAAIELAYGVRHPDATTYSAMLILRRAHPLRPRTLGRLELHTGGEIVPLDRRPDLVRAGRAARGTRLTRLEHAFLHLAARIAIGHLRRHGAGPANPPQTSPAGPGREPRRGEARQITLSIIPGTGVPTPNDPGNCGPPRI